MAPLAVAAIPLAMSAPSSSLAATLEAEIAWFDALLDGRVRAYSDTSTEAPPAPPAPPLSGRADAYAAMCRDAGLDDDARLVLILALLPSLRPQALDALLLRNNNTSRLFTEFGGIADKRGFRPTRETALFLLAGPDMGRRLAAMRLFADDAPLVDHHLLARQDDQVAPWLPLDPHADLLARLIATDVRAPV